MHLLTKTFVVESPWVATYSFFSVSANVYFVLLSSTHPEENQILNSYQILNSILEMVLLCFCFVH